LDFITNKILAALKPESIKGIFPLWINSETRGTQLDKLDGDIHPKKN